MDKAIDLHFHFKNITHYLHPVLLCNISGWQEIDGTFIIKKYHGCKRRNRNSTRKFIDILEEIDVLNQQAIHIREKQTTNTFIKVKLI